MILHQKYINHKIFKGVIMNNLGKMSKLEKIIYNCVMNLHRKTGKEWISLGEIYAEVDRVRDVGINNGGGSVRAALQRHSVLSDTFSGIEYYIMKEKGSGLYKSIFYDQIKFIKNIDIGDVFSHDQLMSIFKISGQSGIMTSNTLNCIVITTSESNKFYEDSLIINETIQYTGQGQEGDQELKGNNKTLYYSKENERPVYLFSKDKNKRYIFEGQVELYDAPYQVKENDRMVWKFPFKILHSINMEKDNQIEELSYKIIEISNNLDNEIKLDELVFKEGPLKIKKYRPVEEKIKNQKTSKPDYIAEEIIKSKQGEINEKVIFEDEIKRLMKEEANEQVKLMEEFFENKKENEGFDVLSFELNKNGEYIEKYIEVKSTKGPESTPIDITDNEIRFAKDHMDNYYLYRIIKSNSKDRYVKVVKGRELFQEFEFIPTTFKIYLK